MKGSKQFCSKDTGDVPSREYLVQLASSAEPGAQAEEQTGLQNRDAYLQSILRAIPSGIGLVVNRVIKEVNLRFCEILGYTRDELVNQSSRMLYLSDEEYAYVGAEKYRQIAQFGSGTVEVRMRRKDGLIINTLLSSTTIDSDDLSQGVTFTVLDITSLKQAEAMLRESEEKYRSLIEQSIQGMIIARDYPPRVCFA
ncbi:MAG: PAS domain S-box protein, partial [Chlorobium limicola]|nr:PAS domain S-box protein [Chlorobium limicola]